MDERLMTIKETARLAIYAGASVWLSRVEVDQA
jgi:hypothetical protein